MASVSAAEAYKIYYNYWAQGNSFGTSNSTISTICYEYKDDLNNWRSSISDKTDYEFDEAEEQKLIEKGRKAAIERTGYDGDNTKQKWDAGASAVAGGAGAIYAVGNLKNSIQGVKAFMGNDSAIGKFTGVKTAKKGAEQTGKTGGDALAYIAAGIAIEEALRYWLCTNKTSQQTASALQELCTMMNESNNELNDAVNELNNTENTIAALQQDAEDANDSGNEEIENNTVDFFASKKTYDYLSEKIANGEATESETKNYESLKKLLVKEQKAVATAKQDTSDTVNDINNELEGQAEIFDETAGTMATIEGITSYAAGFDKSANTCFMVEGYSQIGNAASGVSAGIKLIASAGLAWWQYAIGTFAIAAGASSALAAKQELQFASVSSAEVTAREYVEGMNSATADVQQNVYDYYGGVQSAVSGLELNVSTDVEEEISFESVPQNNTQTDKDEQKQKQGKNVT